MDNALPMEGGTRERGGRTQRERPRRRQDTGWGRLQGRRGELVAEQGSVSSAQGAGLEREQREPRPWVFVSTASIPGLSELETARAMKQQV